MEKFTDLVAIEEEKVNKLSSGKDWYGQSISGPSGSFTHMNPLPGLVANDVINYRYTLVAHDETFPRFTVREGTHGARDACAAGIIRGLVPVCHCRDVRGLDVVVALSGTSSQFSVSFAVGEFHIRGMDRLGGDPVSAHALGREQCPAFPLAGCDSGIAEYLLQQFTSQADDLQCDGSGECAPDLGRDRFVQFP